MNEFFMNFDALSFLYIALGVGFLALVIFLCVALWHMIRVLRDVADASEHVRETAESLSENVARLGDKLTDAVENITDYVVKPLSMMQMFMGKVQPFLDIFAGGHHERDEEEEESEEEDKPKKRARREKRHPRKKRK